MGHTQSVLGVDLSPDGRTALSASWDKTIKLWDIASGREIQTLTGHSDWVRNVAFASDGWKALSASNDKTVRFWDFTRPTKHIEFERKLPVAYDSLAKNPDDADALSVIGQYYAFRGNDDLASQYFERSRKAGGQVSPLMLGRCYWRLSRYEKALAEFRMAKVKEEAPEPYLNLCMDAIKRGETPSITQSPGRSRTTGL